MKPLSMTPRAIKARMRRAKAAALRPPRYRSTPERKRELARKRKRRWAENQKRKKLWGELVTLAHESLKELSA